MRFTRKSAMATASMVSLTTFVGVLTAVAVFEWPVLGFNRRHADAIEVAGPPVATDPVATPATVAVDPSTTLAAVVVAEAPVVTEAPVAVVAPPAAVVAPAPQVVYVTSPPAAQVAPAAPVATAAATTTTTTEAPTTTTTTEAPTTTTTAAPAPVAGCAFTGIDAKGKYTTGAIEVEKATNLKIDFTVTTAGSCAGPVTLTFTDYGYTVTLSGSGTTWKGQLPKGALRNLTGDMTLAGVLAAPDAAAVQVGIKTVVRSGDSSS